MTGTLLDFKTRKRLNPEALKVLSPEENRAFESKVAKRFSQDLVEHEKIEQEISEKEAALALELLEDSKRDVIRFGAKTIIQCVKLGGSWSWKWVNLKQNPEDIISALEPLWKAAQTALASKSQNGEIDFEEESELPDDDSDDP